MPRLSEEKLPKRRHHKGSGQGVVTLGGHDFYLGSWKDKKACKAEYDRRIAQWVAAGRPAKWTVAKKKDPVTTSESAFDSSLTIIELIAGYWHHCQQHYKSSKELENIRWALNPLKELYEELPVRNFGPLALKEFRNKLIERGLSRGYINAIVIRVRRLFRWGASEELFDESLYLRLKTVDGLQRGRCEAREAEPIRPVSDQVVEATLSHLPQIVADMTRLQRLTGARPAEICIVRPCDVDRSKEVWAYRPASHKNAFRGKERFIFMGPRAQAILLPYLLRESTSYCFSPAESEAARKLQMREARKTPVQPSQKNRRKRRPKKAPGEHYDVHSYRRAIHTAADLADAVARGVADKALSRNEMRVPKGQRIVPRWSPNQLRHTAATLIRQAYGLEAASTVLGHAQANVTQLYAERDLKTASAVMAAVG